MIELTLDDLIAFDEPKSKPKIKGESHPFVTRHLAAPQFLDPMGKIVSKRKDNEAVRKTGPEAQVVAAENRKIQRALRFEIYRNRFLMTLWVTQQWS